MRLAKSHLDIGLFTNDITSHRVFWSETVGLRLDHELDFGNGTIQHRYDAHDSPSLSCLRASRLQFLDCFTCLAAHSSHPPRVSQTCSAIHPAQSSFSLFP